MHFRVDLIEWKDSLCAWMKWNGVTVLRQKLQPFKLCIFGV